jgi:hypothetical protein
VKTTLDKLIKGSAGLDKAYCEAIQRIDGQLPGRRLLARRSLSWISYAQRLLTTKELCHILAIEPGDRVLNSDNIYDIEDVISVCAGLVTVDEESSTIRLVHYTTQEYFERVRLEWNPGAQREIAVACLTYLSFDMFQSGSCTSDTVLEQRLADNTFLDYSAHYWSEHIRPVENTMSRLALAFLYDAALIDSTIQAASKLNYKYKGYSRDFPKQTSGLHLIARYGLLSLTGKLLLETGKVDIDSKDNNGRTPLLRTGQNGDEAIIELLLKTGKVDIDSRDNFGWTPLSWAAQNGHEAIFKLLLKTGKVDVDSRDSYGSSTPLLWAAQHGHEAIVKLLKTG